MDRIFFKILIPIAIFLAYFDIQSECSMTCYECTIQPPPPNSNRTTRLCSRFDESEHYEVTCSYSTFCTKKIIRLDLPAGKSVTIFERGCAPQAETVQNYKNDRWNPETRIAESIYEEGCFNTESFGLRETTNSKICYCSSNLCNKANPSTEASFFHHTDTMAVIFIFNVIKFLRSFHQ